MNIIRLGMLTVCLLANAANACVLIEVDFQHYFDNADHVFKGQLVDGSDSIVRVEEVWKGTPFDNIPITIPEYPTSCDLQIQAGQAYVFFESGEPPFQLMLGTGTTSWDYVPEDWLTSLQELVPE